MMRRIQVVFAALAVVVAAFAASVGPAMAQSLDCRDARGDFIRCDGDLYAPYDDGYYWDDYYPYNDYWWGNGWDDGYYYPYYYGDDDWYEEYEDWYENRYDD